MTWTRLPVRLVPVLLLAACSKAGAPPPSTAPEPAAPDHHAGHDHAGHDHAGHDHAGHDHAGHDHHAGHAGTHRFDDADEWAKRFDAPGRDEWQRPEAVIDLIAPAPDAVVADLGAGTGYFAVRLARRVSQGRVLANDVEPDMVRYLGERATKEGLANLVPVQGKPDDPALPEAVDIAFMCNVAHHIEDRVAYFRKVGAKLRPGGRVVIVDFKKDAPEGIPGPPPSMRIAADALVAELAEAGLALARVDRSTLPYQYVMELELGAR